MGHSSSPVIAGDLLVIQADQKFGSYIAAFDVANGEIRWKVPRQDGESWSTPLVRQTADGSAQILTVSRGWAAGHSLTDGRLLWRNNAFPPAVVASPVVAGQTVYAFAYGNAADSNFERSFKNRDKDGDGVLTSAEYGTNAFMAGIAKYDGDRDGVLSLKEFMTVAGATIAPSSLVAFRFGANDAEPRELWRYERNFVGVIPSPLVYRGVVYLIKNGGIFERLDAETGDVLERGRIREAIDGYSSSPVAAGGKVYVASEAGKVIVLEADREWSTVSVNDFEEPIFATPALSRGQVFVRTESNLYCFGAASEILGK